MKRIVSRVLILLLIVNVFGSYGGIQAVKAAENHASVRYRTHCQTYGWLDYVKDGALSGTEGQSKRLESIQIQVDSNLSGSIEYSVHCQTFGWMPYEKNGAPAGTTGLKKRLESIKIRLTGELAEAYDVVYRVHRQTYGWTDWVKNDTPCGTTGQSKRLEAIQIKLVEKNATPVASVSYRTHCQTYGWLNYVKDGASSGTEGQSKRLEAIQILVDSNYTGGVTYSVHCQTYGWMDWKTNATVAGTSGQSKRLEAIKISLTGELAEKFDVYYRVHSQTYGWLDWAKNGEVAGTSGLSKRLESIQIKLVTKGNAAPGEITRPYVTKEILNQDTAPLPSTSFNASGKFAEDIEKVTLNPMQTGDAAIDAKVSEILASIIKPDMTNAQKLWAINQWMIDNAVVGSADGYTKSWNNTKVSYITGEDRKVVSFSHPIIIGSTRRYGTCINYASAFVVMARALGFEAYRGAGRTVTSGGGSTEHYWMMIKAGNVYYNFDPEVPDSNHALDASRYFGKTQDEYIALGYEYVTTSDGRKPEAYINEFNNFKHN